MPNSDVCDRNTDGVGGCVNSGDCNNGYSLCLGPLFFPQGNIGAFVPLIFWFCKAGNSQRTTALSETLVKALKEALEKL